MVFVASCSGEVFALDRETGLPLWTYHTRMDITDGSRAAQFHGDPLVLGDAILIGSDTAEPNHVYAFGLRDGEVLWKRSEDAPQTDLLLLPAESGEQVVGHDADGDLVALDPDEGSLLWQLPSQGRSCGGRVRPPVAHDGVVYSTDLDGHLRTVRAGAEPEVLWRTEVGCPAGAPRLWRGSVYLGTTDRRIVRLALDGEIGGERTMGSLPHSRLTPAGDVLVALVGETRIVALTPDLERIAWERETDTDWSAFEPITWRDRLLVGDAGGNLLLLEPSDGSVAWRGRLEGGIRALAAEGDVLYVGTLPGTIYAYRPLLPDENP